MSRENKIVFSTEFGRHCPVCGQPLQSCICGKQKDQEVNPCDSIVRVRLEKKGRNGKEVTSVRGIPGSKQEALAHLSTLKRKLGTGGVWKSGIVEIQGNQTEKIIDYFKTAGFKVRKDGG